MTYNDVLSIAKRLSKETKDRIDNDVAERMEVLSKGNLSKEDLTKMEDCLYMSLVIQEYLNSEVELLEEEKMLLLTEMEEMYNEYGELLSKAKIEEKLSRKRKMALELRRMREELLNRKKDVQRLKQQLQTNKKNLVDMQDASSVKKMKSIAGDKQDLPNPDKGLKLGIGGKNRDKGDELPPVSAATTPPMDENDVKREVDKRLDEFKRETIMNAYSVGEDPVMERSSVTEVTEVLERQVEEVSIESGIAVNRIDSMISERAQGYYGPGFVPDSIDSRKK